MDAKILFFDDIFSTELRKTLSPEELVWDDRWVSSVEKALAGGKDAVGVHFNLVKSGEINDLNKKIDEESPDIALVDVCWPEHARAKHNLSPDCWSEVKIGTDIVRKIKTCHPELPIVVLSAKPNKDIVNTAYRAGASFFIEKVTTALSDVQSSLTYVFFNLLLQAGKVKL